MWGRVYAAIMDQPGLTGDLYPTIITQSTLYLYFASFYMLRRNNCNAISPASARPRNIFLPHRHCNMVPPVCGSDSLLTRDCTLMLTSGVIRVRLNFNFFTNFAGIVNSN